MAHMNISHVRLSFLILKFQNMGSNYIHASVRHMNNHLNLVSGELN